MKLTFTEEQEMLQSSVRKFFEKEVSTELVKDLQKSESDGHSKNLWNKIAQAGWLSVAIPEKYNGAGGTLVDLGIIYEEAGRVLLPTTFYSTIFASLLIEELGTEDQKATYLTSIAEGATIASIAFLEPQAMNNPDCYTTVARKVNDRYYQELRVLYKMPIWLTC
jgi:alkylation response protein AidB-like acyl-CoA dehydrogenase